jgi:hypothetical protein
MAKKQKVKPSVYLTDQSSSQLKELVVFLEDRISEMEVEEDWMEDQGENLVPLLRGLVTFLREEHLEEDDVDDVEDVKSFEEDEEDDYEEDGDGELDF